eukprot:5650378-Pleurochrysis_carterae.AAC.2
MHIHHVAGASRGMHQTDLWGERSKRHDAAHLGDRHRGESVALGAALEPAPGRRVERLRAGQKREKHAHVSKIGGERRGRVIRMNEVVRRPLWKHKL